MLRDVIGVGAVLRQKLRVPLAPHHFAMLAQSINRRIQNHRSAARPQTSPRLAPAFLK